MRIMQRDYVESPTLYINKMHVESWTLYIKCMLYVYTGDGKGKTTAAIGLLTRAIGAGKTCAIVFFDKNPAFCNELPALQKLGVQTHIFGINRVENRSFRLDNNEDDLVESALALKTALKLAQSKVEVLVLDEVLNAVRLNQIAIDDLINLVDSFDPKNLLCLTGRGLPDEIKKRADLISEIFPIKHPFNNQKIIAQKGIDF